MIKLNGKKIAAWLLAAIMLMMAAAPAWAANSDTSAPSIFRDDSVSINRTQVESGKVKLDNIRLTAKASEKFLMLEKSAMEYAAQKGMNIGVTTNYMSVSFPASTIVNSDEWQAAVKASPSFNFVIELNDDYTFQNLSQAFSATERAQLGCTTFVNKGATVEMYLRGANKRYTYIDTLDSDITLSYNYAVEFKGAKVRPQEQSLVLVWVDVDRKLDGTKTTDKLLATKVDTATTNLTVKTPYTCGAYLMASKTGADNTKTVLTDSSTGSTVPTGEVNTGGVPAWAAASVAQMQQAGVVPTELSGRDFTAPISRAEFAAYIARLLDVPQGTSANNPFKDVKADDPYYKEILAAAGSGLVAGRDAVTFDPNAKITRQEMAVLFSRALTYVKAEVSADTTRLAAMPDAAKVSPWAKNSAAVCINASLIAGKDGGRFAPLDNTSWVEAVVMLTRLQNAL